MMMMDDVVWDERVRVQAMERASVTSVSFCVFLCLCVCGRTVNTVRFEFVQ